MSLKSEVRRLFAELAGRIFMGMGDPREAERLVTHLYEQGESPSIIGRITEAGAEPVTFEGKLAL